MSSKSLSMMDELEQRFQIAAAEREIAGAVISATDKTGIFHYAKAFGSHSAEPGAKPLDLDTTFWILSATKLMTAVAALQCVERGLISLDEDITRVLPEWKDPDLLEGFEMSTGKPILRKAQNKITLRMLMTHSSGLGYDFITPELLQFRQYIKDEENPLVSLKVRPLLFEPGEGWAYSCGLDWAGQIVERVNGGVSLEEYMRENIWNPLGMDSTTFRLRDRPDIESRLSGTTFRLQTGELINIPRPYPDPAPRDMGGAGAYTSVSDYMKLLTSLLCNDEKILAKRSLTELFKTQLRDTTDFMAKSKDKIDTSVWPAGIPLNHSLGGMVNMEAFPSGRRKGSMSWMGGVNLFWWIDPESELCGFYASATMPSEEVRETRSIRLHNMFETAVYEHVTSLR